jgi:hypothetical protein
MVDSSTTGATSGTGTVYTFEAADFILVSSGFVWLNGA